MTEETLITYSDYQEVKEGVVIPLTSNLKNQATHVTDNGHVSQMEVLA